ncbi:MAG: MFS transporter [Anaerolineae bacterium]|nr:MFS transporter [Anaerolineae bacterium]
MSVESIPAEDESHEIDTSSILTVSGGHFVHDTFSAFLSPLLPRLIEKLGLTLTQAGDLAVFVQLPSLLSVLIGYMADRVSVRYLVIFSPAVTATLITMLGLTPSYAAAAILLFCVGISVMSFHAPAPAIIAQISANKVGRGMSIFMAGGELGRSVGPLLVGYGVTQWGIEGLWRLMIFGWIASAILFFRLKDVSAKSKRKDATKIDKRAFFRVFAPLFGVMVFRSLVVNGLSVFMVVYLESEVGLQFWLATVLLALYELAGVGGALSGGTMSDRIGRKQTMIGAIVFSAFFMYLFLNVSGLLILPVLMGLGLTALSVTPVIQALVQEQLPENRATASGMFILFAFIIRAINIRVIAMMGDSIGLPSTLMTVTVISLIAIPLVLTLPDAPKQKRA